MRCTPCSSTGSPTTPHVSSSRRRRLGLDISWDVSVDDPVCVRTFPCPFQALRRAAYDQATLTRGRRCGQSADSNRDGASPFCALPWVSSSLSTATRSSLLREGLDPVTRVDGTRDRGPRADWRHAACP